MKRILILLSLAVIALLLIGSAYALFTDKAETRLNLTTATLKICGLTVEPDDLGQLVPGDSGEFTVSFKNCGSIPGQFHLEISEVPDFLTIDRLEVSGTIEPDEVKSLDFTWNIPEDSDLGDGGQMIDLKIDVSLVQIVDP